jgi:serine/threonine-protein kinase
LRAAGAEQPASNAQPTKIGRYEVLDVIGKGAMGVVYKARDPLLDREVAIKTIHAPSTLGERVRRAFFERFEREAKSAARINHPAIVTIFDVGLEESAPFLVMEFLPGETLADRLDRGRMPLPQAVECARELASALGCAHRQRIVHRDVKPANVLHAGDSHWKLADFGIARVPDSDLTQVGVFMGTPGYAPPEAIREGTYTVQSDVFAWGAVFYELLCSKIPYEGPDTQTTNRAVLAAEPPSPRVHDPSIPEPLAQVALRALAHDPKKRYADGNAVADALTQAWQQTLVSGSVPIEQFTSLAKIEPVVPRKSISQPTAAPPQKEVKLPDLALALAPTVADTENEPAREANRHETAIVRETSTIVRGEAAQVVHTTLPPIEDDQVSKKIVYVCAALLLVAGIVIVVLLARGR